MSESKRPLVGVGVVVLKGAAGDEQVLLIRRGKAPRLGTWSLPGGRQRHGETVRAAAAREVMEETGLEVEISHLLDVVDSLTRDSTGAVAYHYTLVDFLAEWCAGEARAGDDAAEVLWADPRDLDRFALWSETLRIVALALDRRG